MSFLECISRGKDTVIFDSLQLFTKYALVLYIYTFLCIPRTEAAALLHAVSVQRYTGCVDIVSGFVDVTHLNGDTRQIFKLFFL